MTPHEVCAMARDDFRFYAESMLRILDKTGMMVPLRLNRAQLFLHSRLESLIAERGRVRALILKGRQQGVSTYLQARLRWLMKHSTGRKAYVLAHEQPASDNLFKMAKRYHDNEPTWCRPSTGAANAKELWLDKLDCRIEVATAGTREVGRSGTAQYFHASEYAFWPTPEAHWAGIGQVVPDMDGTEIYVESTANGVNNDFYRRWKAAIAGRGDFAAIFIPWFWQPEYTRQVGKDWSRTAEEDELAELYGLANEQLAWRRAKIESDFAGDETRFQQEYPSSWQEAFVNEKRDTFIPGRIVQRAMAAKVTTPTGPLLAGVDPARYGDDRTAIVVRQGRRVRGKKTYEGKTTMEVAGIVARFIESQHPDRVFVDVIGIGAGVYDRLVELGYGPAGDGGAGIVQAVNVAERAVEDDKYVNRRAECWGEMKRWLEDFPCSLPDDDDFLADLTAPGYTYDSSGRLRLESKELMRGRGEKSPDVGDALALTFAEPVRPIERAPTAVLEPPEVLDMDVNY